MDQPIHLVLVNGLAILQKEVDGSPKTILSQLFPRAIIDDFSFLSPSTVEWRLHQRALALLEQLLKTWGACKTLPIVFLAHGLGGFVVKQALVSAVEEPRYRGIALNFSGVLFFGVPHRAAADLTWEYLYLRLLSALPQTPRHLLRVAAYLVEDLEDVSGSFRTVPCRINVANYYQGGEHPLIDAKCSMMGKQDFRCDCRHEELWHFVGGKVKAEDVVSQILATRNTYSLPLGEFLRTLSILDPQTHRLRPTLPAADTPAYTPGHVTLVAWKSEPTARILCVSGLSGSGTTVFASRVLGELLEHHGTQDSPVLSFAFSRSNPRARSPFGLCLSLCRQLVSFQPQLFRHVSSVASFWMGSGCFTTECLWILFRSMVMSLVGKGASVYCVICSLDDCVTSPDEAVHRMEELAIAGDGRFKLVFTHTDSMQNALGSETGQRYCIALDNSSQIMEAWKKQHIQSRIQDIVQGNASWDGLTDLALAQAEKLPSDSPYLLIKANMILLEWITKGWTRKQLKERLQQPPSSLQECYDEVIRTIKNDCRTWVLIALQWIACAARPMRPAELAVAVALSQIPGQARRYRDRDSKYMYEIHDMIRRDILADLRDCMAPFIQVENNRVSFIHVTFRDFLLTNKPSLYYSESGESENDGNDGNDEDYHILNLSLEYLRQIEQSPSRSINDSDSQYFLPADHEYALLAYATLHWPDHFLKTASREAAQEHVLQFLKDSKRVSSWAAWYEQLNPSLRRSPISINSPLQIVSRFGLSCLVDVSITLLEEKIQLEEREDEKSKCLDLAAEHGHHDVVKTLLNMGIRSKDALGLAAEQGYADIVESILVVDPEGINRPNQSRYAPIHHATCGGHKHVVSLLLDSKADADSRTAKAEDNTESAFPTGGSSGSDSDADSNSDLNWHGSHQGTLTDTIPASVWNETSLHLAARTGQSEIIKLLLSNNADLHAVSSVGYDALKYAAVSGFVDIVTLLLDKSADRDKPSATDGNTALHLAAAHGHVEVVELLIIRGAGSEIHLTNKNGLTPIDLAARQGHLEVLNSVFSVMDRGQDPEGFVATSSDKENEKSSQDHPAASPTKATRSSRRLDPKPGIQRRPTIEIPSLSQPKSGTTLAGQTLWYPANNDGRKSALEWAAENGHCLVVRELLDRLPEKFLPKAAEDGRGNTALHIAAKGGHSRTVKEMLKNPRCARLFPVNCPNQGGMMTPLHLAAKAGHADVVKTLLHFEAKPDLQDKKGWTPLHHAATRGHLKCVDELLEHKSSTNIVNGLGQTALHLAAKFGQSAVVRRLVSQDHSILWIEDEKSAVALDLVVAKGALAEVEEFVQMLEDVGGKDFPRLGTPLHSAARNGHEQILQFLLDRNWKCSSSRGSDGETPLHEAVSNKFYKGVELLLKNTNDCDVNAVDHEGDSPLHRARQLEIVEILLSAGAKNDKKNNEGETPSFLAVWRGNIDILQALLSSKPKPDTRTADSLKWTLLHAAYDNDRIVKMLLEHDVDLNAQTEEGFTPLSLALTRGYPKTAEILISAKADTNKSGDFTSSPLYSVFSTSMSRGNVAEMVKSLVENGADLLKKDNNGVTALHLAVRHGELEVVDYIIDTLNKKGPEEKISDLYRSALCGCVSVPNFNSKIAERLVGQGLDINRTTGFGWNALQAACANGTEDTVRWLLSQNVDINAKGSRYGTALCAAIESTESIRGKVSLLLKHETKIEINLSNEGQPTPLQRAVSKGYASVVKLLLQHKADINLTKPGCDTPLNIAISQQAIPLETIVMLLDGADIHKRGPTGKSPVHMAAISDRLDVMERLCSAKADTCAKDDDGLSPLMYGLLNNSVSIVKFLLSRDAYYNLEDVDPKGQTPLIVATILGDKTDLNELLSSRFKEPHILNAQDVHGKTALSYAVQMDHLEVVQMLISNDADPSITDCRGYSPLYWAVRIASQETIEVIIAAMERLEPGDTTEHWSVAVHGAVASGKRQALERLLRRYDVNAEFSTPDGWTSLYTAWRYESDRMEAILRETLGAMYQGDPPSLKRPGRWHPEDKHPGIEIDPQNPAAFVTDGTNRYLNTTVRGNSLDWKQYGVDGVARTDFPMLPLLNGCVYYFEVTLNSVGDTGDTGWMAVGFCDDQASLFRMLGWETGGWGFHSDDGNVFEDGRVAWTGMEYHKPYGEVGVTIGCGVNFAENTAFYTRDGSVIGKAFTEIRGKLYPAVSLKFCQKGWRVSAVFPGEDGKSDKFVFKGDCEGGDTLVPPEVTEESSEESL